MAILKHLASKNADYGEALKYLMFQHDEYTGKPILNGNGKLVPREEYYLDGINCVYAPLRSALNGCPPDIRLLSAPTWTGIMRVVIFMCILSSTACGSSTWNVSRSWNEPVIPVPGTNTIKHEIT